jgi:hypothetical protein
MFTEDGYVQLTFYYRDGHNEAFNVYAPISDDGTSQTLQLEVRHLLKKDWWIVNLPEQTVFINVDNVVKVEMKPPAAELRGDDVFANAERVTALTRSRQ